MRIVIYGKPDDIHALIRDELYDMPITSIVINWEEDTNEQKAHAEVTAAKIREVAYRRGCKTLSGRFFRV